MSSQNILLDSDIRDWVVLPLFVIMVSAGLLRVHMGNLLKPAPKDTTKVTQRAGASIRATSSLKTGAVHFLSSSKLETRKLAYPELLKEQVEWCENYLDEEEEAKKANEDDDDMPNPLAAMDGMKGNMVFMVQNMAMMQGIQFFFSGFILLKVPFHLTMGFRSMFQRGLVSSQSRQSHQRHQSHQGCSQSYRRPRIPTGGADRLGHLLREQCQFVLSVHVRIAGLFPTCHRHAIPGDSRDAEVVGKAGKETWRWTATSFER